MRITRMWLTATAIVAVFGFALPAFGQADIDDPNNEQVTLEHAQNYCKHTGGLVELRHPVFGTNNPQSSWLQLAGGEYFCQYTAGDGSRIHVSLGTLTAKKPTLAALAYYAKVAWNGQGNGNPASFYCTQLGGAEIGATDFAGGAWVSKDGIDQLLETCVFPDNSTIDSWGLLYHSAGIIRGRDLAKALKYPNPYTTQSE